MEKEFKMCILCSENKHFTEFHKNLNRDGRFNVCKKCHYKRNQARRKDPGHKEKYKEYGKSNSMFRRYGIRLPEYNQMVHDQKNKCLICEKEPTKEKAFQTWGLHIDHCHETGKIRGLLCHLCNRGIGLFRENKEIIKNALIYLEKFS